MTDTEAGKLAEARAATGKGRQQAALRDEVARMITLDHLQLLHDFDVDGDLYRKDPECGEAAYVVADAILALTEEPARDPVGEAARVLLGDEEAMMTLSIELMREHKRTLNTGKGGYHPALKYALRALSAKDDICPSSNT